MPASTTTRATRWPHRRARAIATLAVASLALVGCGESDDDGAATTTSAAAATSTTEAASTTEPGDPEPEPSDPDGDVDCPDRVDVEALVGGPVDRTRHSGGGGSVGGPAYSSEGCSYELDDGGTVVVERVALESDEDGFAFDVFADAARAEAAEDGFTPIDDLGDDAYRDGPEVAVLVGPTMAFVAVEPAGDVDPEDDPRVQAWVDQVAADLVALDLTVDLDDLCDEVADVVAERVGPVAESGPEQGGQTFDDVSFETTGCQVDLDDGREVEVDLADSDDWDAWVAAHEARGAVSYEGASIGELGAFDTGSALVVDDDPARPLRITTDDLDLEPAEAAELRRALAELVVGAAPGEGG